MSLTLLETQLVQSMWSAIVESTVGRELLAEETHNFSDPFFANDGDYLLFLRVFLLTALTPGTTVTNLCRKLGKDKRRTIERHLATLRKMGLFGAWTRIREGQWKKPGTRYGKGGPTPMQYWLMGDPNNPLFQNMDLETCKSLWTARKFLVQTPDFRDYLARSMIATSKIIVAASGSVEQLMDKVPELKLLSTQSRNPISYPRFWLEDEAAAYAASRLLFALPEEAKEELPPGETRRLSFST